MGQGVIGDVSAKLVETFAENLAAMLAPEPGMPVALPPVDGKDQAPPVAASSPPPRAAAAQSTLPVGRIAAGVIAGRLAHPRTLAIVAVSYAVVFAAIGFLIGRLV
jgi:hypothetical protein